VRLSPYLAIILALGLNGETHAQASLDAETLRQLSAVEERYFGHERSDADEVRVVRVEKEVFGSAMTGDLAERIHKLAAIAGTQSQSQSQSSDTSTAAPPVGDKHSGYVSDRANAQPGTPRDEQSTDADDATNANYPRVTALENAILGKAFEKDALALRLGRMEKKAFGAASTSDDMGDRTDALEKYTDKKLHKKLFPDAPQDDEVASSPGQQQNQTQPSSKQQNGGRGRGAQAMNMLGNALLGMAGLGGFNTPLGMQGVGPQQGYRAGGHGGTGGGIGGGRRQMQNQQRQDAQSADAGAHEDPMVFEKSPPPPQAKTIVKVGWCEFQLFGKTFSEMHLSERLDQLNEKLNFSPHKSGISLMDDVDRLIRATSAFMTAAK